MFSYNHTGTDRPAVTHAKTPHTQTHTIQAYTHTQPHSAETANQVATKAKFKDNELGSVSSTEL